MDTLFEMPARTPRQRGPRSQQERCKRCRWSASDDEGAYCRQFDVCIEFEDGKAIFTKTGTELRCDGVELDYGSYTRRRPQCTANAQVDAPNGARSAE
jgi:hypothetical protein